jgi:hypothetical protein
LRPDISTSVPDTNTGISKPVYSRNSPIVQRLGIQRVKMVSTTIKISAPSTDKTDNLLQVRLHRSSEVHVTAAGSSTEERSSTFGSGTGAPTTSELGRVAAPSDSSQLRSRTGTGVVRLVSVGFHVALPWQWWWTKTCYQSCWIRLPSKYALCTLDNIRL